MTPKSESAFKIKAYFCYFVETATNHRIHDWLGLRGLPCQEFKPNVGFLTFALPFPLVTEQHASTGRSSPLFFCKMELLCRVRSDCF
jgi:hypothetical protein